MYNLKEEASTDMKCLSFVYNWLIVSSTVSLCDVFSQTLVSARGLIRDWSIDIRHKGHLELIYICGKNKN